MKTSIRQPRGPHKSAWICQADACITPVPLPGKLIEPPTVLMHYDCIPLLQLSSRQLSDGKIQHELLSHVDFIPPGATEYASDIHLVCTMSKSLAEEIKKGPSKVSHADVYLAEGARFWLEVCHFVPTKKSPEPPSRLYLGDFSNVLCDWLPSKLAIKLG